MSNAQSTRATALILAGKPGGVTARDLGIRMSTAYANLAKMTAEGLLVSVPGGKGKPSRHFTTEAAANKWIRDSAQADQAEQAKTLAKGHRATRAQWAKDAPAIFTSKTKYTIAPPPPVPTRTNTHAR